MWRQSGGNIDAFVDFMGSGGTFAGCAKALKMHNPAIRCYVAEPETAAVYAGLPITNPNHKIQGGGYNQDLPLVDKSLIDGYITVCNDEATQFARELARREGVFAGFSSGANVCAAIKLLRGQEAGKNVVLTLNDSGLKYLSTDLFDDDV